MIEVIASVSKPSIRNSDVDPPELLNTGFEEQ
jgi:hypothetical protein